MQCERRQGARVARQEADGTRRWVCWTCWARDWAFYMHRDGCPCPHCEACRVMEHT